MNTLRDRILALASDTSRAGHFSLSTNSLYERLVAWHGRRREQPPISRGLFYRWFGAELASPSHQLLECIPAFAALFGVEEYELFAAAGLLRPGLDAPLTIASAARQVRQASRLISRVLTEAAVPSSGEAIIADRILHHKLDYQVSIWPVVRGHARPLHLHSLIALQPLEPDHSKQRKKTADIERLPLHERRDHIRYNVISDGIWRAFGMMWRETDARWNLGKVPLTIELPIEERSRASLDEIVFPELRVSRILVLGPPWAHAELMAALIADALRFGSMDLRYQGFPPTENRREEKRRFCVDRLREARDQLVWAIGEGPQLMSELTPELLKYGRAADSLVIVLSYGQSMRSQAARVFDETVRWIDRSQEHLQYVALELNRVQPIICASLDDADVCTPAGLPRAGVVDRNLVADAMRHLTAQVLNLLYDHRSGPAVEHWGDRFDDVRDTGRRRARIPEAASWARWYAVEELTAE
jgi:hypothetical protein